MTDFLILYEHKNRELENACLLAAELELRGYKVSIKNIYSVEKYWKNASVVIVPHLYNESQLHEFCNNYKHNNQKIISLQYEQVLREVQHEGLHNPSGEAVNAQHVAWGDAQKERYLEHGIKIDNIHVVGHIGMDLDRNEFDGYYFSRDEVAKNLDLDPCKRWFLFISTFGYRLRTQEDLDAFQKIDPTTYQSAELSIKAQEEIEKWIIDLANSHKDIIFIYRRHPSERKDPKLCKLEQELSNFRCIDDYTIRQWVRVADLMHTWYSTSIADAYYAGRMCYIDRPFKLPEEYELDIMHESTFICNYEQIERSIDEDEKTTTFPIPDHVMKYYYGDDRNKRDEWSFKRWADLCEKILTDDNFTYNFDHRLIAKKYKVSAAVALKRFCYQIVTLTCYFVDYNFKAKSNIRFLHKLNLYSKEMYRTKRVIKETKAVFKGIIRGIDLRDSGGNEA